MQSARMLGNYVERQAKNKDLSISDLGNALNCSENQVYCLLKGRAYASFDQVCTLATLLNTSVERLLTGDPAGYHATVVHCMNEFQDVNKREEILDLIDDYVDIVDAVTMHQ